MSDTDTASGALRAAVEAADHARVVVGLQDVYEPTWDRIEYALELTARTLTFLEREAKRLDRKQADAASQPREGERLATKTNDHAPVASPSGAALSEVKHAERRL